MLISRCYGLDRKCPPQKLILDKSVLSWPCNFRRVWPSWRKKVARVGVGGAVSEFKRSLCAVLFFALRHAHPPCIPALMVLCLTVNQEPIKANKGFFLLKAASLQHSTTAIRRANHPSATPALYFPDIVCFSAAFKKYLGYETIPLNQ